ncbi:GNAT family N-acetyltransferase [Psychrobacillus sp. AK 1817]|uniref:GNAT family N-acetyltransferase n=1 Tax=Psychrobacillus sp. AK 1817 TaxID=2303505 RepID=UPI001243D562|nr:GNAT family N-acetyltransferase [Psychrobacillus sp. AK 1817]QEY21766.1 GNAT family N-acetyltransferase [Psychrobacillus sp. AK 1817]
MLIESKGFNIRGISYTVRSASQLDADQLSKVRLQIDGETQNLDREQGEAFIDKEGFKELIENDSQSDKNLFLVAEVNHQIVGFSRCEGSDLKRFAHKVEFGVCILKEYWGLRIGTNFLKESIAWADANDIKKIALSVLHTNEKAIALYQKYGFEVEGILKNDKMLAKGEYYHTVVMGRSMV